MFEIIALESILIHLGSFSFFNMAVSISSANTSHVDVIRDLAERIWWPTYGPILDRAQLEYMLKTIYSREAIIKVMNEGSQTFIMLEEDGVPKGFASYGTWSEQPHTWKIHKLYVLPENHGKGFGRMLINEINTRAKNNGVATLVLNVNRHNPAYGFYLKSGFKVLREEDIPIGPYWMNDYVMMIPVS